MTVYALRILTQTPIERSLSNRRLDRDITGVEVFEVDELCIAI